MTRPATLAAARSRRHRGLSPAPVDHRLHRAAAHVAEALERRTLFAIAVTLQPVDPVDEGGMAELSAACRG